MTCMIASEAFRLRHYAGVTCHSYSKRAAAGLPIKLLARPRSRLLVNIGDMRRDSAARKCSLFTYLNSEAGECRLGIRLKINRKS